MFKWRNLGILIKIGLLSVSGVMIMVLALWGIASWQSSLFSERAAKEAETIVLEDLGDIALGILNMVHVQDEIVKEQLSANLNTALYLLEQAGGADLVKSRTTQWVMVDATTLQTMTVSLPQMSIGGRWLGDASDRGPGSPLIDELISLVGGTATLYQRVNEQGDMLCVASSSKVPDGRHTQGSLIPAMASHGGVQPMIASVLSGKTYEGSETVGDDWHRVAYAPLRDSSDAIIGMLSVGVKREGPGSLRRAILGTEVGVSGEAFVLAARGEQQGVYRVVKDGLLDGRSIWDTVNADGRYVAREIVETALALEEGALGTLRYSWQDPGETEPQRRIMRFTYYEPWDWVIAVSAYEHEVDAYQDELESGRSDMLQMLAGAGALISLAVSFLSLLVARSIATPLRRLAAAASEIVDGEVTMDIDPGRSDETGLLARSFTQMAEQIQGMINSLELKVAERTHELVQRSAYLSSAADVARVAAQILDVELLLSQVVELIRENFGLYYVGLFLSDDEHVWAVLRAGTGDAGRRMLARHHRIRLGEGMVGWSIANAQARIALDVGEDAVRLSSAELPDTRSEAALPLRSRGRVLGALTVQSVQPAAFDDNSIGVLQIMADLVAVALENAQLLAGAQEALAAERKSYGEMTQRSWGAALRARRERGYRLDRDGLHPLMVSPTVRRDLASSGAFPEDPVTVALPLTVREQTVGLLRVQKPQDAAAWSEDEMRVITSVAEQTSAALESARLYEDTLRRIERERLVREIVDHIRASGSVEQALQRAISDMSRVLGAAEVVAQLGQKSTAEREEAV